MNVVSFAWLFALINLMYITSQLIVIGVAVYFWRRYPRPSLYLAIMALLEVGGSLIQSVVQFMMNWSAVQSSNVLPIQVMASSLRFVAHILAMCFLVAAVYVARRPNMVATHGMSLPPGTPGAPGMESSDESNVLDPSNPYSPPRQPR